LLVLLVLLVLLALLVLLERLPHLLQLLSKGSSTHVCCLQQQKLETLLGVSSLIFQRKKKGDFDLLTLLNTHQAKREYAAVPWDV